LLALVYPISLISYIQYTNAERFFTLLGIELIAATDEFRRGFSPGEPSLSPPSLAG